MLVEMWVDLKTSLTSFGDAFKAELSEFLDDWAQSDLRVTHGRASSTIESEDLAKSLDKAFKVMTEN